VLLFNLDAKTSAKLPLQVNGVAGTWKAQQVAYGKAEYDQSQYGKWVGPTRKSLGQVKSGVTVTVPPWSMNVISLDR
jgi:hypothetical protein